MPAMDVPGSLGTTAEIVEHGPDQQIQIVEIQPGGEIPIHSHNVTHSYVILKGTARLVGGEERTLGPGDVGIIPAGAPHGWRDIGASTLRFVSISTGPGLFQKENWDMTYHNS